MQPLRRRAEKKCSQFTINKMNNWFVSCSTSNEVTGRPSLQTSTWMQNVFNCCSPQLKIKNILTNEISLEHYTAGVWITSGEETCTDQQQVSPHTAQTFVVKVNIAAVSGRNCHTGWSLVHAQCGSISTDGGVPVKKGMNKGKKQVQDTWTKPWISRGSF